MKSSSSWPSAFLCALGFLMIAMSLCDLVEATGVWSESTLLQRQAGVFLPLLAIWWRIEVKRRD